MSEPHDQRYDDQLYDQVALLKAQGRCSELLWREFLCRCCRSVLPFMIGVDSLTAIESAEAVAAGEDYPDDLRRRSQELRMIEERRWAALLDLRPDSHADWPVSIPVDWAWVEYYSALSLRLVTQECLSLGDLPTAQSSLFGWANYRLLPDADRMLSAGVDVISLRNDLCVMARHQEEQRQLVIFNLLKRERG